MPSGLRRHYGAGYLHFITSSCYQRAPLLGTPERRDLFLRVLEQTRQCYHFIVVGYVVMPEHIHLLISEPAQGSPSTVMQVLKQRFASAVLRAVRASRPGQGTLWDALEARQIWQRRFYDFVVWNPKKRAEKLRYMHRNPVKRGLVSSPEDWLWSSFSAYAFNEEGPVVVNERQLLQVTWARKSAG
jgi:putative transposase